MLIMKRVGVNYTTLRAWVHSSVFPTLRIILNFQSYIHKTSSPFFGILEFAEHIRIHGTMLISMVIIWCWQLSLLYRNTKKLNRQNSAPEKHCGVRIQNSHWNHMYPYLDLKISCGPGQFSDYLQVSMVANPASKTHVHSNKVIIGRSLVLEAPVYFFSLLN